MAEFDVISLSSDSRPSSPFINISEVLSQTKELEQSALHPTFDSCGSVSPPNSSVNDNFDVVLSQKYSSPIKNRFVHELSDSDSSETEVNNSIQIHKTENDLWNKYGKERDNLLVPSFDFRTSHTNDKGPSTSKKSESTNRRKAISTGNDNCSKDQRMQEKELKMEEKLRKQREKEMIRAEKLAAQELQRQIKPGICNKYMTVILDSSLVTCSFGGTLIAAIQNSEFKYEVSSQTVPFSISWTRELPGSTIKEESHLVVIWEWQMVIPAMKSHTLCSQIEQVQAQCPGKSVSLVIYGLNGYFNYLKNKRKNASVEPSKGKKRKKGLDKEDFPFMTRKDIEEELIELQIMANCNHRLMESQEDLGQLIVQITKAIAETPFKMDKHKRELESLEWFAVGDSRDCVAVDKAGNGLLRLWQQQLCQFNLAGHDVAQAIAAVYPSPLAIVQAYDKCASKKEAEELLKDIQVRRCQGPLASNRRIGPELSKKICTFFCSTEGQAPLSQEQ